ncbi:hypothetical protein C0995_009858 [Termitomyces sp. Mi166|nr:hypothetical protein C0995_009858 [Termitomyces sp. Mi166\
MWKALLLSSLVGIRVANACTGTINSLADVSAAVACKTVNINSFTVPGGQALTLDLMDGSTVNLTGPPLPVSLMSPLPADMDSKRSVVVNGNGHIFDGGGPFYWDGLGGGGGIKKPDPMMKIRISGTFSNLKVVNSPQRTYSVSNPDTLVMSGLTIDNSQGDLPNAQSDGRPAGTTAQVRNHRLMSANRTSKDDCLAINKGSNIIFRGNTCTGGHGISIGSISSDATVTGITISGNTVINNDQALRIKTDATATGSSVSNITYSGNTATGCRQFGILIDQSYPDTLGTPGNGVKISAINFVAPTTNLAVNSDADRVAVNCGVGTCTGTWNWANLKVTGGSAGPITNFNGIAGFSQ